MAGLVPSPFLDIPASRWLASNRSAFAVEDAFPASPGHCLVIPRRVFGTWWEATREERSDLFDLVDEVKARLDRERHPDGFNVGFNAGAAAGQTVDHLHVHVIPRYAGDALDPRGGVRHAVPGRGNYLLQPGGPGALVLLDNRSHRVVDVLRDSLQDRALDRADLMVSFVMLSGVALIRSDLQDALDRGLVARILTTDYLGTTEPDALAGLMDLADDAPDRLAIRVFSDSRTSFHPKAYLFSSSSTGLGRSLVGSSNLSRSGIELGVEWTLETGPARQLIDAFEQLWDDPRNVALTHGWLRSYRLRRPIDQRHPWLADVPEPVVEEAAEAGSIAPEPRPIQGRALAALDATRADGYRAGLVVMATGLGKTWLAAFEVARLGARRVLFVAHREEILRQSRDVFRMVMPGCDAGLYTGQERAPDADFVFASVQSLGRSLDRWAPDAFEVVVVDEFHHASAPTYRKVIEYFRPEFFLGLTATPDRLDGADLLALCGDNLVFECGLVEGIREGELCPFTYRAERDVADFAPIPWRNGRFDPAGLAAAVETAERAGQEIEAWRAFGGTRTMAFCCSVTHADFMADFFTARGVKAKAVHSGPTSASRQLALEQLAAGELEVIFTVDLFNEGIDVPELDTVLMLRPTDSPVVFLQQLGRGLRQMPGKQLMVVDFIGNHRSFLFKPRTLLSAVTGAFSSTAEVLAAMRTGEFGLPEGCSVHYDLEVVDLLEALRRATESGLTRYCREYFEEHGRRPSAVQAWRSGFNPGSQPKLGWFGALDAMGLLADDEAPGIRAFEPQLRKVEKESITKSYKLVALRAFLDEDGLRGGVALPDLAARSRQILSGDPLLAVDIDDHLGDSEAAWDAYWRKWPVAAWTGQLRGAVPGVALFEVIDDRMVTTFEVPEEHADTLRAALSELVDYRLVRYLDGVNRPDRWTLRVSQASGRPIIWLARETNLGLPTGQVELEADGVAYQAQFMKVALNVLRADAGGDNRLPDLLRAWFGAGAGAPGSAHRVILDEDGGRYRLRPLTGGAGD